MLTDRLGEFTFQRPVGIGVEVDMPEGANVSSLLGYQPLEVFDRILANDPACLSGIAEVCKRVYVLVP